MDAQMKNSAQGAADANPVQQGSNYKGQKGRDQKSQKSSARSQEEAKEPEEPKKHINIFKLTKKHSQKWATLSAPLLENAISERLINEQEYSPIGSLLGGEAHRK